LILLFKKLYNNIIKIKIFYKINKNNLSLKNLIKIISFLSILDKKILILPIKILGIKFLNLFRNNPNILIHFKIMMMIYDSF
jgi:hypothetical protein